MRKNWYLPNNSYCHRPPYPTIFVSHLNKNIATQTMPNTRQNLKFRWTLSSIIFAQITPCQHLQGYPTNLNADATLGVLIYSLEYKNQLLQIMRSSFSSWYAATPGWTLPAYQYLFVALIHEHCCWNLGNQTRQDYCKSTDSKFWVRC